MNRRNNCTQSVDAGQSELRHYLFTQYAGVLDDQSIEKHIRDYVGFTFANQVAPLVAAQTPPGGKILDIGAGFGAFVLAARRLGLEAIGIEIAGFEVKYAHQRWRQETPENGSQAIYHLGNGLALPFGANSFEAVTLWNVLEHISDAKRLLFEVKRVLKPAGCLYIICPNYAAFRQEAHYLLFWPPLLPRKIASLYLKVRGKDPNFFETSVFYRTNWEVLRLLQELDMEVRNLKGTIKLSKVEVDTAQQAKLLEPTLIEDPRRRALLVRLNQFRLIWLVRLGLCLAQVARMLPFYNPFKESVILSARKGDQ